MFAVMKTALLQAAGFAIAAFATTWRSLPRVHSALTAERLRLGLRFMRRHTPFSWYIAWWPVALLAHATFGGPIAWSVLLVLHMSVSLALLSKWNGWDCVPLRDSRSPSSGG